MGEDDDSVAYLKQSVGPVLQRAFYDLAAAQPADAVAYLGTWLNQYVEAERADMARRDDNAALQAERDVEAAARAEREKAQEAARKEREAQEAAVTDFQAELVGRHTSPCDDGVDPALAEAAPAGFGAEFQRLVDAAHGLAQPTVDGKGAAYMAQVETVGEGEQVLRYTNVAAANENHEDHGFLLDKTLASGQGVTWEAFKSKLEPEEPEEGVEQRTVYNPVFVQDVVNDTVGEVGEGEAAASVHFWKVTRLGQLLVVPIVVPNCLTEGALEQAKAWLDERQKKLDEAAAAQQAEAAEAEPADAENPAAEELVAPDLEAGPPNQYALYIDTLSTERTISKKHKEMIEGVATAFGACKQRYDTYLVWQQAESLRKATSDREAVQAEYAKNRGEVEAAFADSVQAAKEGAADASAEDLARIDAEHKFLAEKDLLDKQAETVKILKRRPVIGDGVPQVVAAAALLAGMDVTTVLTRGTESVNWELCRVNIDQIITKCTADTTKVTGARTGLHAKQLLTYVRSLAAVDASKFEDKPETEPLFKFVQAGIAYRELDLKMRKSAEGAEPDDDDWDAVEVEAPSG